MFTSLQKAALVRLSFIIISADDVIQESESKFAFSVWKLVGVDAADVALAKEMTAIDACNIVSNMDASARELICAILGCLVVSDGNADPDEIKLWGAISEVCGMPTMTIAEATRIVREKFE